MCDRIINIKERPFAAGIWKLLPKIKPVKERETRELTPLEGEVLLHGGASTAEDATIQQARLAEGMIKSHAHNSFVHKFFGPRNSFLGRIFGHKD